MARDNHEVLLGWGKHKLFPSLFFLKVTFPLPKVMGMGNPDV